MDAQSPAVAGAPHHYVEPHHRVKLDVSGAPVVLHGLQLAAAVAIADEAMLVRAYSYGSQQVPKDAERPQGFACGFSFANPAREFLEAAEWLSWRKLAVVAGADGPVERRVLWVARRPS